MIKLIKNGLVITMDESRTGKIEKLDIVIEDDKVKCLTKKYVGKYDYVIDANNKIVMPGLVNAHTHLGMSVFRASNDSLHLMDWLNNKIWPIEDNMTADDVYYSTLESCYEMIKTGTTLCNDMYMYCDGGIKAVKDAKVRCLFSRSTCDNDDGGQRRIDEFLELYNKNKDNDLVKFTVAPHSMYTCSKEYLKECSDLAIKLNVPLHIHFCEDENEVEGIKKNYNMNPAEALDDVGLFRNKLILAHGTFLNDKDLEVLKGKDASIVTNPISNLNLGCGIANIVKYKDYVNVCLGTDGQGSGNNMNLFYHMSILDLLQKGTYKDPTIMNSYDVLKIATVNGAKALGFNDVGVIKENYKADIIILDMNDIMTYPTTEVFNNIVHNAYFDCVDTTIINGEILMENKKVNFPIDIDKLKEKISEITNRVI